LDCFLRRSFSPQISVIVFDPSADAGRALSSQKSVRIAASAEECIAESSVAVLATPWQEFRDLPASSWLRPAKFGTRVVIDCWRTLAHLDGLAGLTYVKLGFGSAAEKPAAVSSSAD
jgi:predicted dinucleotide-binding enzyme